MLVAKGDSTGWKGNKFHHFNSRRGRFKAPIYTIWGLNLIVSSEKGVSCSVMFASYCLYRQRYAKKIYISRFILQGRNTIFKNILRVRCSLRKIKQNFMRIFRSEHHGNAVKKTKGTLTLRKLKIDVLTVQRRGPRLSTLPFVRSFKLK